MKHKKVAALLILVMFILPVQILAVDINGSELLNLPKTQTAYLYDDSGNVTEIEGRLVQSSMNLLSILSNEKSVTYEYTVTAIPLDHENTAIGSDKTAYTTAYLTIYYTSDNKNPTEYLLTKVSGNWNDPDPKDGTHVATTGDLTYYCSGSGTSGLYFQQSKNAEVSSNFLLYTGFKKSTIKDADTSLGANLEINLSQGPREWKLSLPNVAF